jgi:hypothetical protein
MLAARCVRDFRTARRGKIDFVLQILGGTSPFTAAAVSRAARSIRRCAPLAAHFFQRRSEAAQLQTGIGRRRKDVQLPMPRLQQAVTTVSGFRIRRAGLGYLPTP